ncbi:sensor histidine kinase [Rhodococcus opacus]|uniref:sensor histidine kinase n=1 Tax=Rhodococcus opacus TaxID=37919 RepID=UPI00211E2622|nr:ATP-binding protein [Rhodococcus opacus]
MSVTVAHPRAAGVSLSSWPLRWKMAVVLAVPLLVAASLGGLRVQERLREAADFAAVAEQVRMLPLLVGLDADAAVVMGTLAQRTITPELIDTLDNSIRMVENANPAAVLDGDTAATLARGLAAARALSAQAKRGPTSTTTLTEQLDAIRTALSTTVTAIAEPIGDKDVVVYAGRLEGLWTAQKTTSAQGLAVVAATGAVDVGSSGALDAETGELLAHLRTEAALIEQVAGRYPPGDPNIAALRQRVDDRIALLPNLNRPDSAGQALTDLKYSLFASVDDYAAAVGSVSAALGQAVTAKSDTLRAGAWRDTAAVTGLLLTAIALAVVVARSLLAPLRRVRRGALEVARARLPDAVARIKADDDMVSTDVDPIDVHTTEEIGQLARAIDDIHSQALRLAGEQAHLRLQMTHVFETLARRSRSLIDSQLELIEQLEFEERDPTRLDNLFRLDHLATRMRRNGENLLILAGNQGRRTRQVPIPLTDAARAAISEVEDYRRVQVGPTPPVALAGAAGVDLVHILAELIDNSLQFSPPDSDVTVRCTRTADGGLLVEVADRGIGLSPSDLSAINDRLAATAEVTADTARRMGLFVVSELAARHTMTVVLRATLQRSRNAGVTAVVHIPGDLLVSASEPSEVSDRTGSTATPSPIVPRGTTHALSAPTPAEPAHPTTRIPARPADTPREPPSADTPAAPTGLGALPRRTPGATGIVPAPNVSAVNYADAPPPSTPHRIPGTSPAGGPTRSTPDTPTGNGSAGRGDVARHRLDPARTAAFFEPRILTESSNPPTGTPIFAALAPVWLTDPTTHDDSLRGWRSRADAGWEAARRATGTPPETVTATGLPQRIPGRRLVPGGVDAPAATPARVRTPDTVRANLSRHQRGVRAGRTGTPPDPHTASPKGFS